MEHYFNSSVCYPRDKWDLRSRQYKRTEEQFSTVHNVLAHKHLHAMRNAEEFSMECVTNPIHIVLGTHTNRNVLP
jgi:hypothetical protein